MHNQPNKQFLYTNEKTPKFSAASMFGDALSYGSLRKELAMATLKKRRGYWYARVLWYKNNQSRQTEKQVPLRTQSKVTARERLAEVNKVEDDIKSGMNFIFPWLGESPSTSVKRFTLNDAVELWLSNRKSSGIRSSTIKRNWYSMKSFMSIIGYKRPLTDINTSIIDRYIGVCIDKGMTPDGININLRSTKTFLRWCCRRNLISKVPHIDMVPVPNKNPLYLPDHLFLQLMSLDWLDERYKTAFLFYYETGCRASEPFIGELDENWLLISGDKTKQRADKELRLNAECLRLIQQMRECMDNYTGKLESWTQNLSKTFKKAIREIDGNDTKYHLHCLRHTFAVRRYLQTRDIYLVKQEMGHASVKTTEKYAKFSLRRLEKDFPSIVESHKTSENTQIGTQFVGTPPLSTDEGAMVF